MLPDYEDIKAAAGYRTPDWYDGNGVPRYKPFDPSMLGVYDRYALLAEIECQSCRKRFLVGEGWTRWQLTSSSVTLTDLATGFHYGDPPIHDCVGDTMNCVDIRIVEAWEKLYSDWTRNPTTEAIDIYPDWAKETSW